MTTRHDRRKGHELRPIRRRRTPRQMALREERRQRRAQALTRAVGPLTWRLVAGEWILLRASA